MKLNDLIQPVLDDWKETNQLIDHQLDSEIPVAHEVMQYLQQSSGKRLRPLLVLLSAQAFDYGAEYHIACAAMLELLHTASLLHDDVVDRSELRRGQQTVHAKWGNHMSILVGDLLIARALQILADIAPPEDYEYDRNLAQFGANAAAMAIEGEMIQWMNIGNPHINEATYLDIIERKTAKPFAIAAMTGPFLCHYDQKEILTLRDFGNQIGIAFQLIDDALDYTGDVAMIGKHIGDDLVEGKLTLPLIYALRKGDQEQRHTIRTAIQSHNLTLIEEIQNIIAATGAIDYTTQLALQYRDLALTTLGRLPATVDTAGLENFAHFVVERSH